MSLNLFRDLAEPPKEVPKTLVRALDSSGEKTERLLLSLHPSELLNEELTSLIVGLDAPTWQLDPPPHLAT